MGIGWFATVGLVSCRPSCWLLERLGHCLTYTVYEPVGKPRRVSGYQLLDGHWASAAPYDATCSDGSPVRITVETDWPLPQQPANPIPRLAGIQRDIYAVPCVKVVESQLVMERIGD